MDADIARRFETLENLAKKAAAAGAHSIQVGSTQLANGISPAIAAYITADSKIFACKKIQVGDVNTVEYEALNADRVNGAPGSFKITAIVAGGGVQVGDDSTLDWLVVN